MGNELLEKSRIILLLTNDLNKARKTIEANEDMLKDYRLYKSTIRYDNQAQTENLDRLDAGIQTDTVMKELEKSSSSLESLLLAQLQRTDTDPSIIDQATVSKMLCCCSPTWKYNLEAMPACKLILPANPRENKSPNHVKINLTKL